MYVLQTRQIWTLAEIPNNDMGDLTPWANLAATVIIAGLFIWVIMQRDPKERERNRIELAEARNEYRASLQSMLNELAAERQSREAATERFLTLITEHREKSHEQRMEDRKIYHEATRAMLQECIQAIREAKNAN